MPICEITGRFKSGNSWAPFQIEMDALNSSLAIEHCYSTFGSKHNLKRNLIVIEEVSSNESS